MLLTNIEVAQKLKEKAIFRVHDKPDAKKVEYLFSVASLGHNKLNKKNSMVNKSTTFFQKLKKKRIQHYKLTRFRSMSKAEYSTKTAGHHGLSLTRYLHFTSQLEDTQTSFAIGYCPLF